MQDHLTKLKKNNYCPRVYENCDQWLEAMEEKQLETFASDRLIVSKVTLNKIEI